MNRKISGNRHETIDLREEIKLIERAEVVSLVRQLAMANKREEFSDEILNKARTNVEESPTLIHEYYFADYIKDLFLQSSEISRKEMEEWPYKHINWDDAADEVEEDYTEIQYKGEVWLWRAP